MAINRTSLLLTLCLIGELQLLILRLECTLATKQTRGLGDSLRCHQLQLQLVPAGS